MGRAYYINLLRSFSVGIILCSSTGRFCWGSLAQKHLKKKKKKANDVNHLLGSWLLVHVGPFYGCKWISFGLILVNLDLGLNFIQLQKTTVQFVVSRTHAYTQIECAQNMIQDLWTSKISNHNLCHMVGFHFGLGFSSWKFQHKHLNLNLELSNPSTWIRIEI